MTPPFKNRDFDFARWSYWCADEQPRHNYHSGLDNFLVRRTKFSAGENTYLSTLACIQPEHFAIGKQFYVAGNCRIAGNARIGDDTTILEFGAPILQLTELWLATLDLLCRLTGIQLPNFFRPRGIHRLALLISGESSSCAA